MIATSHVIVGGAVGLITATITKNPGVALVAGIISHLLCDCLPHLDAPFKIEHEAGAYDRILWTKKLLAFAITDSLFAFFLTLFLWDRYFDLSFQAPLAWGALGGYLPDLLDNFPLWSKPIRTLPVFKQFHALHLAIHNTWRHKYLMPEHWILGTLTQLLVILPSLWYILR